MSRSLLRVISTNPTQVGVIEATEDVSGVGSDKIFAEADTISRCSPNSVVKYVNIRDQISIYFTSKYALRGYD